MNSNIYAIQGSSYPHCGLAADGPVYATTHVYQSACSCVTYAALNSPNRPAARTARGGVCRRRWPAHV